MLPKPPVVDPSPCEDGEEPRSAIVSGVTLEPNGTVHTHQDRRHGFQEPKNQKRELVETADGFLRWGFGIHRFIGMWLVWVNFLNKRLKKWFSGFISGLISLKGFRFARWGVGRQLSLMWALKLWRMAIGWSSRRSKAWLSWMMASPGRSKSQDAAGWT